MSTPLLALERGRIQSLIQAKRMDRITSTRAGPDRRRYHHQFLLLLPYQQLRLLPRQWTRCRRLAGTLLAIQGQDQYHLLVAPQTHHDPVETLMNREPAIVRT